MNVLALLNGAAGTAGKAEAVAAAFAVHGVTATIEAMTPETCSARLAEVKRDARSGRFGFDALVVGGGDGTISGAASAVVGTGIPLGILPMGTLNHFAKDLRIPLHLEGAVAVIAAGGSRRVDVGDLNGRVFVNNSSIGIYPFLVSGRTAEQRRHGLGKVTATALALVRAFRHSHWRRCTVTANGLSRSLRTACVFVGNNVYDLKHMGERARLDEGRLCVYIVKQQTWLGLLMLPFSVGLGRANPKTGVELLTTGEAGIAAGSRHMHVALDGEAVIMATPLIYKSRPGQLLVFCVTPVAGGTGGSSEPS